jgi:hypothetical protein
MPRSIKNKLDMCKPPLISYYNSLVKGREPYSTIWFEAVGQMKEYAQKGEGIYAINNHEIEQRVKMFVKNKGKVNSRNIGNTIAAGLLASKLVEGREILGENEDFFRNASSFRTNYHVKLNEKNLSKIENAFK